MAFIHKVWQHKDLTQEGFDIHDDLIVQAYKSFENKIETVNCVRELLLAEAVMTKQLYKYCANICQLSFEREHKDPDDLANIFLNHGNYLAYGLAATTLWVLGIPHGFAVMHGKTRRGALVFDVADLIKDAIVLPWAFVCAKDDFRPQEFRQKILQKFTQHKAMAYMFDEVKRHARHFAPIH